MLTIGVNIRNVLIFLFPLHNTVCIPVSWAEHILLHSRNLVKINMRWDTSWSVGKNKQTKKLKPLSFVSLGLYSNVQNRIRPQVIKQKWSFGSQDFTGRREREQPTPINTLKAAALTDVQLEVLMFLLTGVFVFENGCRSPSISSRQKPICL